MPPSETFSSGLGYRDNIELSALQMKPSKLYQSNLEGNVPFSNFISKILSFLLYKALHDDIFPHVTFIVIS